MGIVDTARSLLVTCLSTVLRWITRSVYRLEVHGVEHLPAEGGAVVVCNHLSYADPFFLGSASPRPLQFLMYRRYYDMPGVGAFARLMGAIPVAAEDGRRAQREALAAAVERARAGELVCIFPEGGISRSASLLGFARGFERIARTAGVPVIPVALDGVWGSLFSYSSGRVLWKRPGGFRRRVRVEVGAPLPAGSAAWEARAAVARLAARARERLAGPRDTLSDRFLRSAARNARRLAVVDGEGRRLRYRELLRAALVLRAVCARRFAGEPRVGVYLPPGAGGALANLALTLAGREAVNLNYSLGSEALRDPIGRAGLRHVITSPRFVKALGGSAPCEGEACVALEDLVQQTRLADKLRAVALSFLPGWLLARLVRPTRDPQRVATVLFSSGSTGRPKGVELTHANVLSNVIAFSEVIEIRPGERLLGILPFFHSFGYTVTLWAPLLGGAVAVYHARPTDAKRIGALSRAERVTIAIATPTFYQAWMRRTEPEAWAHTRLAFVGAEKLRPALARAWRERFGCELLEGYGCTELSPVVAVNLPDLELGGERLIGHRPGTVGRPLPGVCVEIVHPETHAPLAPGVEGAVVVRGPNVMRGYLDEPERTAEVLRDGAYDTGDVGKLDRDGFLELTGRRSRFSKIGGEMVPHEGVELALQELALELAPAAEPPGVAVSAVPDEKKGERLVVLHTALPFEREAWLEALRASDLPALYQPRADQFFEVPEIPCLGTGKTDLRCLHALARELSSTPLGTQRAERSEKSGNGEVGACGAV